MVEYSPIIKALTQVNISEITTTRLKRKFDVAYIFAEENLSFTKIKIYLGVGGKTWSRFGNRL